jgi:hypothetical protein
MTEDEWKTHALPILQAVHQAREVGDDLDTAAKAAVPTLSERACKQTIADLSTDGYLEARILAGDNDPLLSVHIRALTPRGL